MDWPAILASPGGFFFAVVLLVLFFEAQRGTRHARSEKERDDRYIRSLDRAGDKIEALLQKVAALEQAQRDHFEADLAFQQDDEEWKKRMEDRLR